ncbi:MAG: hypothetical protein ACYDCQ_03245 [Dehalococcoidia bacterium]
MVARRRPRAFESELPRIIELSEEESRQMVEREVQEVFGMTAEEFLCKWYAGEIPFEDRGPVVRVLMMLGLAG